MNKIYRPSIFSVLLQLKDLINEIMKISKWSKLLAKVGVFTSMFYLLVEFSIKFPAIYVNIKKYRFLKKNRNRL